MSGYVSMWEYCKHLVHANFSICLKPHCNYRAFNSIHVHNALEVRDGDRLAKLDKSLISLLCVGRKPFAKVK